MSIGVVRNLGTAETKLISDLIVETTQSDWILNSASKASDYINMTTGNGIMSSATILHTIKISQGSLLGVSFTANILSYLWVEVSENGENWIPVLNQALIDAGGYSKTFSLESYVGKKMYFRIRTQVNGGGSVTNRLTRLVVT